jgi:hypothetical protein
MTRYFMHLRDGTEELLDPKGRDFSEPRSAAGRGALYSTRPADGRRARWLMELRFRIDAEDEDGAIIYTLPFKHAVNIIPAVAAE